MHTWIPWVRLSQQAILGAKAIRYTSFLQWSKVFLGWMPRVVPDGRPNCGLIESTTYSFNLEGPTRGVYSRKRLKWKACLFVNPEMREILGFPLQELMHNLTCLLAGFLEHSRVWSLFFFLLFVSYRDFWRLIPRGFLLWPTEFLQLWHFPPSQTWGISAGICWHWVWDSGWQNWFVLNLFIFYQMRFPSHCHTRLNEYFTFSHYKP